ncbi:MAG: DUF485 domain-containing protein [Emcibacter sp.]|nr:DUF485 domain-containing protein [Emcibacter sp.]
MSQSVTEKCLAHPKFKQLIHDRSRFSWMFSLIIVVGYGFYVLGMAYAPGFMSSPLREGSSMTYGILTALLVIISGMVCSGIYTWWSNRNFDELKAELLEDLGHE